MSQPVIVCLFNGPRHLGARRTDINDIDGELSDTAFTLRRRVTYEDYAVYVQKHGNFFYNPPTLEDLRQRGEPQFFEAEQEIV